METTEGLGKAAEVWVGGSLLTVCDGVSAPERPEAPGVLEGVAFKYVTDEGVPWEQALRGNPGHKKRLDPLRGWAYVGYGQVVSIMPVVIDFGLLQMPDPHWTTDDSVIGRYVQVPIDRLEIVPAAEPDWPADAR